MHVPRFCESSSHKFSLRPLAIFIFILFLSGLALTPAAFAAPRIIVISIDGGTPRIVNDFLNRGILPADRGIGLLKSKGFFADRMTPTYPSLTAVNHLTLATGSSSAANDIASNTFHLVASPFTSNVSGFGAPIGGYSIDGPAESANPTAFPIWHSLRAAGKTVVTATWPGGDGVDVRVPGLPSTSPIVQSASVRTVDYTVPFGEFGGVGGAGFTLTAADFSVAPQATVDALTAAGKTSFSPVLQKTTELEHFTVGLAYSIQVAALDTTDDGTVNYDTLVFFDSTNGIKPGPFSLPSTGPAYVKTSDKKSSRFYLEGSPKKAGCAFYVTVLAPDLSTVHIARYTVNDIPPNLPVQANVDDVNNNVGFWGDQDDFRFPERLNPGLGSFSDQELEAISEDQLNTFADYQTRLALRAIDQNPNADLIFIYFEQPDGLEHQYLLVDPRQATNPQDPHTILAGQDPAKVARYASHIEHAYQVANESVGRVMDVVTDSAGELESNIFVVSDHGFDPFHTAVSIGNLLASSGIPSSKVRAVTSGPAVNFYINLIGREPNGTVTPAEYVTLQQQILQLVNNYRDSNLNYAGKRSVPLFGKVFARPIPVDLSDPTFGRGTSEVIGQDFGDVFAMLTSGYNFDGAQSPVVQRLGDPVAASPVLQVPNFYGAHGYDPKLKDMGAIFFAAGPEVIPGQRVTIQNVSLAPTIARILGVKPDSTVQGTPLNKFFKKGH
jgi:predicted AlkP superfamily pyrophosphatase or phosphodiesterase